MRRKSKLESKEGGTSSNLQNDKFYQIPENISDECREVIELMLHKDPDKRISLFDLQHHPWLCRYSQSNKQMWEETSNENGSSVKSSDFESSRTPSEKSASGSKNLEEEQDQR